MHLDIHFFFHPGATELLTEIGNQLNQLTKGQTHIMATQTEIMNELQALVPELQKIEGEIGGLQGTVDQLTQAVADLQQQIANGDVSQELKDAADQVQALVKEVDDKIPDAPNIPAAMQGLSGAPETDANLKTPTPAVEGSGTAADQMQASTAEQAGAAPSGAATNPASTPSTGSATNPGGADN